MPSTKLTSILDDFGLAQPFDGPTHLYGHKLDVVNTRSDDDFMVDKPATGDLSDHF